MLLVLEPHIESYSFKNRQELGEKAQDFSIKTALECICSVWNVLLPWLSPRKGVGTPKLSWDFFSDFLIYGVEVTSPFTNGMHKCHLILPSAFWRKGLAVSYGSFWWCKGILHHFLPFLALGKSAKIHLWHLLLLSLLGFEDTKSVGPRVIPY